MAENINFLLWRFQQDNPGNALPLLACAGLDSEASYGMLHSALKSSYGAIPAMSCLHPWLLAMRFSGGFQKLWS